MTLTTRHALIAACMMHVEGFYSTKSAAFRNRNPGNIMQFRGTLRTYDSIQDGFNALVQDIAANEGKTLAAFIAKYAPPNENDTSMYATVVSTLTGIPLTEKI